MLHATCVDAIRLAPGDAPRRKLAEQKALGIHLLHPEICSIPVNPVRVAKGLGLEVYKDDSAENIDGWYDESKNAIYLNTEQPLLRRRFTAAHELGHHVMGHGTRQRNKDAQYNKENFDPLEVEANRFAAALLMPAPTVKDCVFKKKMLTKDMAQYFGVSTRAMIIRLRQLGYVN